MRLFRWRIIVLYLLKSRIPNVEYSPGWTWVRGLVGPGIVATGWQIMMGGSYGLGIGVIYAGFIFWILESIFDPAINSRFIRVLMFSFAAVLVFLFTLKVVLLKAPMDFDAYSMRYAEYPQGTVIAGIHWNAHFTDLRVWVKNPTDNDYENLYINIQPDNWNHAAAIVGEDHGCHLSYMGGDSILEKINNEKDTNRVTLHREQGNYSATDNTGHEFTHLIDKGGYRLECARLSAHDSIQIVFALAAMRKDQMIQEPKLGSGQWSASLWGSTNKVNDTLDELDIRPTTSAIAVDGHYSLGPKRITINRETIPLSDRN